MKVLIILTFTLFFNLFGHSQCLNKVQNLSGTSVVNDIAVTVTPTSGYVGSNSNCNSASPYYIGGAIGNGSGGYTFNFSPSITSASLNFAGLSQGGVNTEEIQLFVNGSHYPIPTLGVSNDCDEMAVLTSSGNIRACTNCDLSGWSNTIINGPITSITVLCVTISGNCGGATFSMFICNSTLDTNENDPIYNFQISQNPFSNETNLHCDKPLNNASLDIYTLLGQNVNHIDNISGDEIKIFRNNLSNGLYLMTLIEGGKSIYNSKIIINNP
jgi:hypothetical protein